MAVPPRRCICMKLENFSNKHEIPETAYESGESRSSCNFSISARGIRRRCRSRWSSKVRIRPTFFPPKFRSREIFWNWTRWRTNSCPVWLSSRMFSKVFFDFFYPFIIIFLITRWNVKWIVHKSVFIMKQREFVIIIVLMKEYFLSLLFNSIYLFTNNYNYYKVRLII